MFQIHKTRAAAAKTQRIRGGFAVASPSTTDWLTTDDYGCAVDLVVPLLADESRAVASLIVQRYGHRPIGTGVLPYAPC